MCSGLNFSGDFAVDLNFDVDVRHLHTSPAENYLKVWYLESLNLRENLVLLFKKIYIYIYIHFHLDYFHLFHKYILKS